jgi:serine O-acetyltransferase
MFENVRGDINRAKWDRDEFLAAGGWTKTTWLSTFRVLIAQSTWSVFAHRFAHWATLCRIPVVRQVLLVFAVIFERVIQICNGSIIHRDARIGPGLVVHTPYGVFLGPTRIGANCTVGTGVLIGGGCGGVGDNVYFGPGAKVLGTCKIGNNCVVAANSLVLTDVPDNTTVMGVPARIRLPGGNVQRFRRQNLEEKERAKSKG